MTQKSLDSALRTHARRRWVEEFGYIPADCEIHHRDFNPHNNDIYNLESVTVYEHREIHRHNGINKKQRAKNRIPH